jgi:exonuclease III
VNGLRSVMSKSSIERWIAEEKPLIICLQETKARKQILVLSEQEERFVSGLEKLLF